MDKKSTLESNIDGPVIRQALKSEKLPIPSVASLEFLKNFARNFRVQKNFEGEIKDFVLN